MKNYSYLTAVYRSVSVTVKTDNFFAFVDIFLPVSNPVGILGLQIPPSTQT